MGKEDYIVVLGEVVESLPNTTFKVRIIDENYPAIQGHIVLCTISGKMRIGYIRVLPGDRVNVEVSIYDKTRGRIVYRHKPERPGEKKPQQNPREIQQPQTDNPH